MALVADLSMDAAELYVLRFCVERNRNGVVVTHSRYRPLLEYLEIPWTQLRRLVVAVSLDRPPVERLTSSHFGQIQANAEGFGQLFVWFPPRVDPSADEIRLMRRAGIPLKFVAHKIGVYNSTVTRYNG